MSDLSVKVIACPTVVEGLRSRLPAKWTCYALDFGLHNKPGALKTALQGAIDASADFDVIVLGYGLCSMAVIGLCSPLSTLVIPKVDDCIAIFLGSREAYREQVRRQPGTYYLTEGWIKAGNGPFDEYDHWVEKYGAKRAGRLMDTYLHNYTRLALIDTGGHNLDECRAYTRATAQRFGLRYEEIPGSTALLDKMIRGSWDGDFAVVPPGRAISYDDFVL